VGTVRKNFADNMNIADSLFVLSAVAFNLLIAAIFIAQKFKREKLVRVFGILWLCLLIPLVITFLLYWRENRETWIFVSFGFVFLYMLVELLLDYVFKIDFRSKPITHVPYIVLEYAALFSLIGIAFEIGQIWGAIVSICFWILMGSLVFLYSNRIFKKK
jgi:hypothetical protein